jgi:hypothetical protein
MPHWRERPLIADMDLLFQMEQYCYKANNSTSIEPGQYLKLVSQCSLHPFPFIIYYSSCHSVLYYVNY